jgi:hypothetical protein
MGVNRFGHGLTSNSGKLPMLQVPSAVTARFETCLAANAGNDGNFETDFKSRICKNRLLTP